MLHSAYSDECHRLATLAGELEEKLREYGDFSGAELAVTLRNSLTKLAFDALGETQPIETDNDESS